MIQLADDSDGLPDISKREVLRILMQALAELRADLKADIAALERKMEAGFGIMSEAMTGLRESVSLGSPIAPPTV